MPVSFRYESCWLISLLLTLWRKEHRTVLYDGQTAVLILRQNELFYDLFKEYHRCQIYSLPLHSFFVARKYINWKILGALITHCIRFKNIKIIIIWGIENYFYFRWNTYNIQFYLEYTSMVIFNKRRM